MIEIVSQNLISIVHSYKGTSPAIYPKGMMLSENFQLNPSQGVSSFFVLSENWQETEENSQLLLLFRDCEWAKNMGNSLSAI